MMISCFSEFYNDRDSTAYTSLQSQSSTKALPESKAQTPQPQHQSVVIIDLTANSNSENPTPHFPKPVAKRTMKNPATGEYSIIAFPKGIHIALTFKNAICYLIVLMKAISARSNFEKFGSYSIIFF